MPTVAQTPTRLASPCSMAERRIARTPEAIAEISRSLEPVILRGFVSDWPVVAAARVSDHALVDYVSRFDCGSNVPISAGPPRLKGRMFYNEAFTGLNVDQGTALFATFLQRLLKHGVEADPPLIYMASLDVDAVVPGFQAENSVDFGAVSPLASIWMGTRTRVAAHNDLPLNIACVAAGRRVFTLFPPDQTPNLYIGPFELTPAGRPVSLVDFHAPDLALYPRFTAAMETAQIAELEPGDAIFIPSMWWHHVESIGTLNVLVNYWWRSVPRYLGAPQDVLNHAMLTLRDLPAEERRIWKHMFDHYVFTDPANSQDHIPVHARGILSPIDETMARRVRTFLLNRLNR